MAYFFKAVKNYIKKETVMTIAFFLAVVSSCMVKPSLQQLAGFVDWRVLGILLSLMLSVAGLKEIGTFNKAADVLIKRTDNARSLVAILVMMCFFSSMAFTNDVALITFVPFALFLLEGVGHRELIIKTVVLQTIGANLGSMLTPVGNPQNLYIYNEYKMSISDVFLTMGPYTLIALIGIVAVIFTVPKTAVSMENAGSWRNDTDIKEEKLAAFAFVFLFSLLAVGKIIPWIPALLLGILITIIVDRKVILEVDYALIFTFIFFFIFIGNMGDIDWVQERLSGLISGNEVPVSVCASQFLSNVPATILLSGFTENGKALLIGVNLGGLGTLIASMASLISYKAVAHSYYELKGTYIVRFTIYNVVFLAVMMAFYYFV